MDLGDYGKTSREYVDRLSEWLDSHRDEPFFVFLHVFDPHSPFEPRRPYNTVWSDPAEREGFDQMAEKLEKVEDNDGRGRNLVFSMKDFREAEVDHDPFVTYVQGWYDGSIRAMDSEIARLLERLRGLGSTTRRSSPSPVITARSSKSTGEVGTGKPSTASWRTSR